MLDLRVVTTQRVRTDQEVSAGSECGHFQWGSMLRISPGYIVTSFLDRRKRGGGMHTRVGGLHICPQASPLSPVRCTEKMLVSWGSKGVGFGLVMLEGDLPGTWAAQVQGR